MRGLFGRLPGGGLSVLFVGAENGGGCGRFIEGFPGCDRLPLAAGVAGRGRQGGADGEEQQEGQCFHGQNLKLMLNPKTGRFPPADGT